MKCFCKEESFDLILEADFGADPLWCKKCGCNLDLHCILLVQKLKDELISKDTGKNNYNYFFN